MSRSRLIVLLATAALAGGCISIYRADVQQGNVVTQEMVDKLKPGMTRAQVRFVLGTPLITDPFHPDRWDYYYLFRAGTDASPETRQLTIVFKDDKLAIVRGDIATKASESAQSPDDGFDMRRDGRETVPQTDTAEREDAPGGAQLL